MHRDPGPCPGPRGETKYTKRSLHHRRREARIWALVALLLELRVPRIATPRVLLQTRAPTLDLATVSSPTRDRSKASFGGYQVNRGSWVFMLILGNLMSNLWFRDSYAMSSGPNAATRYSGANWKLTSSLPFDIPSKLSYFVVSIMEYRYTPTMHMNPTIDALCSPPTSFVSFFKDPC